MKTRISLNPEQKKRLNAEFENVPFPSDDFKLALAHELDLTQEDVSCWFKKKWTRSFRDPEASCHKSLESALQDYCKTSLCFDFYDHVHTRQACKLIHPVFMRAVDCPPKMYGISRCVEDPEQLLRNYMEQMFEYHTQPICPICTRSTLEVYASRLANGHRPEMFQSYDLDGKVVRICSNCFDRRRKVLADIPAGKAPSVVIQEACSQLEWALEWPAYRYEKLHRFYMCHGFTGLAEIDQAFHLRGRKKDRRYTQPAVPCEDFTMVDIPGGFLCEGEDVCLDWDPMMLPPLLIEPF